MHNLRINNQTKPTIEIMLRIMRYKINKLKLIFWHGKAKITRVTKYKKKTENNFWVVIEKTYKSQITKQGITKMENKRKKN
jgi:hypothetical protein